MRFDSAIHCGLLSSAILTSGACSLLYAPPQEEEERTQPIVGIALFDDMKDANARTLSPFQIQGYWYT